ncbi:nitrilase-related carbon-nitrogen hydrolase [Mycolicibacterium elephantis]|uniref:nitrilase-related carbon-nitrogen hydrolase n=1 Tax=Mycolicibacterium elephantis TaxID=81858 RepID=UPI0009EEE303|nr:nitrilase-related carbon-nitrogen hydrolase [Mycolicibacterium elephantis]
MTPAPRIVTTVALEQLEVVVGRCAENRSAALNRTRQAFAAGADIVVLPELAISGYVIEPDLAQRWAEPLDGPSVTAFRELAAANAGLVIFGFCERAGEDVFNSVVAVGPDGVVLHYRKLHLFDKEKGVYAPGNLGLPVVRTRFGDIGVCICYDLRFVEVMRILALRGADLVIAPAAWVAGFDRSVPASGRTGHAESLLVQANLNQVAAVAVSQVAGSSQHRPPTLGGSVACDAYGQVLAGPLSRAQADSALVTVDLCAVREARRRSDTIRPREDRRTDVYSLEYLGARR